VLINSDSVKDVLEDISDVVNNGLKNLKDIKEKTNNIASEV
jgi:hypothetical protein